MMQCIQSIVHSQLGLPLLHWAALCTLDKYDISHLVDFLFSLYPLNKIYDVSDPVAWTAWIAGFIQTLLYADFFYYYLNR
jgi:hypothetical protein